MPNACVSVPVPLAWSLTVPELRFRVPCWVLRREIEKAEKQCTQTGERDKPVIAIVIVGAEQCQTPPADAHAAACMWLRARLLGALGRQKRCVAQPRRLGMRASSSAAIRTKMSSPRKGSDMAPSSANASSRPQRRPLAGPAPFRPRFSSKIARMLRPWCDLSSHVHARRPGHFILKLVQGENGSSPSSAYGRGR